jgi:hypothetical protein
MTQLTIPATKPTVVRRRTVEELLTALQAAGKPTPEDLQRLRHALTVGLHKRLREPNCPEEFKAVAADFLWEGQTAKH